MRNLFDLQSLFYIFLVVALVGWQWSQGFSWPLYGLLLFVTIGVQVMHHNHVHLGIWHDKRLNRATNYLISVITAVPSAMMLNGHIKNHHVHQHGPLDVTRTYRFGGDHNDGLGYLLHPFQAFAVLIPMFWRQFLKGWPKTRFSRQLPGQCVLIGLAWAVLAFADWQKFLLFVLLPQAFGLHWLLGANYLQHAHCDDQSSTNYARNFTGVINYAWFNIGFHKAHHDHPSAHWSTLRRLHRDKHLHVDPMLNHGSFVAYFLRTYLLGPFIPSLRSRSLRVSSDTDTGNAQKLADNRSVTFNECERQGASRR